MLEAEGMDELFLLFLMHTQPSFVGQTFQQASAVSTRRVILTKLGKRKEVLLEEVAFK